MTHARLGASSAHRWMKCPASAGMAAKYPKEAAFVSEHALEGTQAHAAAQLALLTGTTSDDPAVQLYVDVVREAAKRGGELLVEQRVQINTSIEPMYGTADAILIDRARQTMHIFDLKYGRGVVVEVKDPETGEPNPQLMFYALAARDSLCPVPPTAYEISLTIVQPRADHFDGPVRTLGPLSHSDLDAFFQKAIRAAYFVQEDPYFAPGKWCRWCPAHAHCPAVLEQSQALVRTDFVALPQVLPPEPETLPIEVAADILDKAHILEDWLIALRQRVERDLLAGKDVPGYKLVAKRPTRKWAVKEEDVVQWYEQHGNPDDLYSHTLRSPAQVETLVGKKNLPAEMVTAFSSGLTLVPASDPRPAAHSRADFLALPGPTASS